MPDDQILPNCCSTLECFKFKKLSENDVPTLVLFSSMKYCILDPEPSSFIVDCLDVLLPVITKIVN